MKDRWKRIGRAMEGPKKVLNQKVRLSSWPCLYACSHRPRISRRSAIDHAKFSLSQVIFSVIMIYSKILSDSPEIFSDFTYNTSRATRRETILADGQVGAFGEFLMPGRLAFLWRR